VNSGIGRVTQWLVDNLGQNWPKEHEIWYLATQDSAANYRFYNNNIIYTESRPFSLDELYTIPILLCTNNINLYINPQFNSSPFHITPTINIIHDFWALIKPDWLPTSEDLQERFTLENTDIIYNMGNWLNDDLAKIIFTDFGYAEWRKATSSNLPMAKYVWSHYAATVLLSSHICLISPDTLNTFKKIFKRQSNITMILNGTSERWSQLERKKGKHFLCLSKLEKRKNLYGLLNAYVGYANNSAEPVPLIIAGDPGYHEYAKGVRHRISELKSSGYNIDFKPSVSDEVIMELYSEAIALIYPSHFEGFGLPPIEAMFAGVPVVASKTGLMCEDIGHFATLFESHDEQALTKIMQNLTDNCEPYERLATLAKVNIGKVIDNEQITLEWCKVIENVLNRNKM